MSKFPEKMFINLCAPVKIMFSQNVTQKCQERAYRHLRTSQKKKIANKISVQNSWKKQYFNKLLIDMEINRTDLFCIES